MNKQMAVAAVVGLIWLGLAPNCAQAGRLWIGTDEEIRPIQPTRDPDYTLCHKVRTVFFIAGVYVVDDGYVLQKKSHAERYYPLDPQRIDELQKSGMLPTPLPDYSLSFLDYLSGFSLWIFVVAALWLLVSQRFQDKAKGKRIPIMAGLSPVGSGSPADPVFQGDERHCDVCGVELETNESASRCPACRLMHRQPSDVQPEEDLLGEPRVGFRASRKSMTWGYLLASLVYGFGLVCLVLMVRVLADGLQDALGALLLLAIGGL